MRTIKEICKELANELNIMLPENVKNPEERLKMCDIMPEEEWKTSGVTCLAARPSMGKTSLAIDFVLDAALWMEKPIVFFSLEATEERLVHRMITDLTGIGGNMNWNDIPRMASAIAYLERLNIFIDDTPAISVSEIKTKLQALDGVGMVVIDYIQLVTGKYEYRKERNAEIRWIVHNISRISEEIGTPFLILSQLTREVEHRNNKRPQLGDLHFGFYSGDVDQVIFLYRERFYRTYDHRKQTEDDSAEIIIAKSKSGNKKTVRTRFDKERYCFVKNEGYDFIGWREADRIRQQEYGVIRGADSKVLLIEAGPDSSIYGYNDKNLEFAKWLYEKHNCSVVISSNPYEKTGSLTDTVALIKEIVCDEPEIYYLENFNNSVLEEKMSGGTFDDLCHVGFTRLL